MSVEVRVHLGEDGGPSSGVVIPFAARPMVGETVIFGGKYQKVQDAFHRVIGETASFDIVLVSKFTPEEEMEALEGLLDLMANIKD